ncbi:hypothetical protein HMN09_01223000 [Mycena chlorophos]|uniref:Amidohydrolase-related domain-containing protein n=1 Tax=Mycena chlorophos TaxID=658473 RepID=A0A8H6VY26_MYCCL|nr:hypothetical protein HMN09_01223000 [Mycena chlorophos]
MPRPRRIDVHHHYFEASLNKAKPVNIGWRAPQENHPWTPQVSLNWMDAHGVDVTILSFPALWVGKVGKENRDQTRQRNEDMAAVCRAHPTRFGFFAMLPFMDDVEGALDEIAYALDVLKADGISMSSLQGAGADAVYIGDDKYDEIWRELNRRKTVLFLHGSQVPATTPFPHPFLGLPITEVPGETFKAVAHLVVSGRKRAYPDIRIIVAHMGGSTLLLAPRVAAMSHHMGCELTPDEIMADFATFYYDTALTAHSSTLSLMKAFVTPERILFGSDFPAVSAKSISWYTKNLEDFHAQNEEDLRAVMAENALRLFPRFQSVD